MIDHRLDEFIRRMPKVELHVHLEGSIQPHTALELMRRNNSPHLPKNADEVRELYNFENLSQFVTAMRSVSNNIVQLQDLTRVADELFEHLALQRVRYVEFDCAIQKYINLGFQLEEIIEAIYSSALAAEKKLGVSSRLIVNQVRSHGAEICAQLVSQIIELNHPFIVGIGLSGDETKVSQKEFVEPYELAFKAGLGRTVHAGEALGPESIWDAIHFLHAQRIDHGTTAYQDARLMDYLKEHHIPLTQCLSSNLRLKVIEDITEHPFAKFFRHGIMVSLHTDDPEVFATSLNAEYLLATEAFHFSPHELIQIVENGVYSCFLPDDEKHRLLENIRAEMMALVKEMKL